MERFAAKFRRAKPLSDIYCLSTVKSYLDEVMKEYLVSVEKYEENPIGVDFRIGIGILCILLCSLLVFLSLHLEFSSYKTYAAVIVTVFWSLSYLESFLMRFFFYHSFSGRNPKKEELKILTKLDPLTTVYTALFYFGKKEIPNKVSANITTLYNSEHQLDHKVFADLVQEGIRPHFR